MLECRDSIMGDKGLDIDDLIKPLRVTINMPPKRNTNRQLTREEVEQRRRIAAVRIHCTCREGNRANQEFQDFTGDYPY